MTSPDAQTMTQTNAEILADGYKALAEGNLPAVLAMFSDDIRWHKPGHNPLSGDYTGHDEVGAHFQALMERSNGTFSLDVHDILDNGKEKVMALVTENAERNGARLNLPAIHLWHFEDGKATRFQNFVSDESAYDAFWS